MKKVKSTALDKKDNLKGKKIKFNLSPKNLACFKGKSTSVQQSKPKIELKKEKIAQIINQIKQPSSICIPLREQPKIEKQRSNSSISIGAFDERLVFIQYQDEDLQNEKPIEKYSSDSDLSDDDIVSSCVRVITEETDNTSEPYSLSTPPNITPTLTPKSSLEYYGFMDFYQQKQFYPQTRNKRSITTEESRAFVIDFEKIELDGRTTIMIKNIPNKYTQEILLSEFSVNHDNTIDFFYLPIDKDNECNVGYAFLNFIHTSYIKSFYKEFHGKKWKKYNSAKICNLCYARYQGTLELANHFRHTKILQQKDRKVRPLIGQALKDIEEMVKNQRGKE